MPYIANGVADTCFRIPVSVLKLCSRMLLSCLELVLPFQVLWRSFVRWDYSSVDSRGNFFSVTEAKPFLGLHEMPLNSGPFHSEWWGQDDTQLCVSGGYCPLE